MDALSGDKCDFGLPTTSSHLVDDRGQPVDVSLQLRLHGAFNLSREIVEDDRNEADMNGYHQFDDILTCYRRNLFQVSGTIFFSTWPTAVSTSQPPLRGQNGEITSLRARLTAVESRDWTQVKIIAGADRGSTVGKDPDELELKKPAVLLERRETYSGVTLPLSWERLQFRSATANNGRKKRQIRQQYRVNVSILASLTDRSQITVATAQSSFITVRGRCPKSFSARNDISLWLTPRGGTSSNLSSSIQLLSDSGHQQQEGSLDLEGMHQHLNTSRSGNPSPLQSYRRPQDDAQDQHQTVYQEQQAFNLDQLLQPPGVSFNGEAEQMPISTASQEKEYSPTMWDWINLSTQEFGNWTAADWLVDNVPEHTHPSTLLHVDSTMLHHAMPQSTPISAIIENSYIDSDGLNSDCAVASAINRPSTPHSASSTPESSFAPSQHSQTSASTRRGARMGCIPATQVSVVDSQGAAQECSQAEKKCRYKYIPLGLDGWEPPVDPVYWPHPWVHDNKHAFKP